MVYLGQFLIILGISFLGEVLHALLPFPIPASVYGMVLLLLALCLKIVKVEQVKGASTFLIQIMPVMFIPPTVGLLDSWGILKPIVVPVVALTVITTLVVMVVTGKTAQAILHHGRKSEAGKGADTHV